MDNASELRIVNAISAKINENNSQIGKLLKLFFGEVPKELLQTTLSIQKVSEDLGNMQERLTQTLEEIKPVVSCPITDSSIAYKALDADIIGIGDIFEDIDGRNKKSRISAPNMEISIPSNLDATLIVGNEANIVEFVANHLSYLLPHIKKYYEN